MSDEVDFHLYPLAFRETIQLKKSIKPDVLQHLLMLDVHPGNETMDIIYDAFDDYLAHGGFLPAINALSDPIWTSRLVEGCATSLYRRYYQTYYIKANGEVDIAYVDGNHFHPIEIKWSEQSRPKDLKQISKYPIGHILSKSRQYGNILGVPTEPLPLSLLRLGL